MNADDIIDKRGYLRALVRQGCPYGYDKKRCKIRIGKLHSNLDLVDIMFVHKQLRNHFKCAGASE